VEQTYMWDCYENNQTLDEDIVVNAFAWVNPVAVEAHRHCS